MKLDFASLVIVIVLLGIFIYLARLGWHRITMINREQELQDFEFEAQMLSALNETQNNDAAFIVPAVELPDDRFNIVRPADIAQTTLETATPNPVATLSGDPVAGYFRQPVHDTMRGPLSQLAAANLSSTIQDYHDYHGNLQGTGSFRLKDGRTGLLVPAVESEAYITRNLKRFDLLVMGSRDGKAYVVTTLEEFLSSQMKF